MIPRAQTLLGMHSESGGTGNERTIPGAVTAVLLKFFFKLLQIPSNLLPHQLLTVQCKTYLHSGTQPLEEGKGSGCTADLPCTVCRTDPDPGPNSREMQAKGGRTNIWLQELLLTPSQILAIEMHWPAELCE